MAALLALASSLLWGTADFGGGLVSRRLPSLAVVGWTQVVALVLLVPVVLLTGGVPPPGPWLGWGLAAGLTGLSGLVCFYRALAIGTMGVVSPIAALGGVVPVLAGVLDGERPGALRTVGMVVALAGAVAASGPELSAPRGSGAAGGPGPGRRTSVLLATAAGVLFGLTLLLIARGSGAAGTEGGAPAPVLTVTAMRMTSLVVFVALALAVRGVGGVRPRNLPVLVAIGAADATANALYGIASTMGLLSVVAVLGSLYPVMTVLLARWVLHERLQRVQVVGVALALGGVMLLAGTS